MYIQGKGSEQIRDIFLSMNHLVELDESCIMIPSTDFMNFYMFYDMNYGKIFGVSKHEEKFFVAHSFPQGWIQIAPQKIPNFLNIMGKQSDSLEAKPTNSLYTKL